MKTKAYVRIIRITNHSQIIIWIKWITHVFFFFLHRDRVFRSHEWTHCSCWLRIAWQKQFVRFTSAHNALAKYFRFFFSPSSLQLPTNHSMLGPYVRLTLYGTLVVGTQDPILYADMRLWHRWLRWCRMGRTNYTYSIWIALASELTHIRALPVWRWIADKVPKKQQENLNKWFRSLYKKYESANCIHLLCRPPRKP